MSNSYLRGAIEWALMVALVCGLGAFAQAQEEEGKPDEGVVQIGRADGDEAKPKLQPPVRDRRQPQQELPEYWIGMLGGDIPADHPLRAHIDLPEKEGLLVANVLPDGPAAKAGLKQNDILLKANNTALKDMKDLIELVKTEGPKKGQITLEVLRHGKRETIYLKPEKRPANARVPQGEAGGGFQPFPGGPGGGGFAFGPGGANSPEEMMRRFRDQLPMEFRDFGPGVIVGGGGQGMANLPDGVSISIQKQNGKPTHITVQRGADTWNIDGDDAEALKKLPEDLRPSVEQMLQGGGNRIHMPNFGRGFGPGAGLDQDNGRLRERLERMEQRLEEMQRRMMGPQHAPADKPKDEHEAK